MQHKSYKIFTITILTILTLFCLTGCSSNPKNFTVNDITITLTSDFEKGKLEEFDVYITSDDVSFTANEESEEQLQYAGYEIANLKDYSSEIAILNGASPSSLTQRDDYYYFSSTKTISGAKYTYVHCLFEGNNSYWMCEFACKTKDYDHYKDDIFEWADSITIKK